MKKRMIKDIISIPGNFIHRRVIVLYILYLSGYFKKYNGIMKIAVFHFIKQEKLKTMSLLITAFLVLYDHGKLLSVFQSLP